jgi:AraC-like DNA-binding protein
LQNPQFKAYGIGDIAWACGFADPSHFARRFRQRYGSNPVRYRAPVELAPADCRFPVILSTSVAPA